MYKTLWKEIMTEDLRRIEYRFLHWGPFVCNYTLLHEEVEALKLLESGEDYRDNLSGHLENEKALNYQKAMLNSMFKSNTKLNTAIPGMQGYQKDSQSLQKAKKEAEKSKEVLGVLNG